MNILEKPEQGSAYTYLTEESSSRGTISSTRLFGVLPSDVTPVAQFFEQECIIGPRYLSYRPWAGLPALH